MSRTAVHVVLSTTAPQLSPSSRAQPYTRGTVKSSINARKILISTYCKCWPIEEAFVARKCTGTICLFFGSCFASIVTRSVWTRYLVRNTRSYSNIVWSVSTARRTWRLPCSHYRLSAPSQTWPWGRPSSPYGHGLATSGSAPRFPLVWKGGKYVSYILSTRYIYSFQLCIVCWSSRVFFVTNFLLKRPTPEANRHQAGRLPTTRLNRQDEHANSLFARLQAAAFPSVELTSYRTHPHCVLVAAWHENNRGRPRFLTMNIDMLIHTI